MPGDLSAHSNLYGSNASVVELGLYRGSSWSPSIRFGRLSDLSLPGGFSRELSARRVRASATRRAAVSYEVICRAKGPVQTIRDRYARREHLSRGDRKKGTMRMLKILTVVALVLVTLLVLHNGVKRTSAKYNPATEVEVQGVVQEVRQFWCPINGDEGTHLMLKTGRGVLEVHVAPVRFLQGNGVTFNLGDQISVVGSMVVYLDHDAMIARKITRGDETMAFRQPNGRPLWVEPPRWYVR